MRRLDLCRQLSELALREFCPLDPDPPRSTMLAGDFLTDVWLTRIYVLFLVSLERRRIEFVASTANPNGGLVAQQARTC